MSCEGDAVPVAPGDTLRGRRFATVEFDPAFLGCTRMDGSRAEFTRQERAVLQCLIRHAGSMCTRTQLLAARADTGRSATQRTIDLLINRLRAKLGDDARRPAMILTQYGEGYVWAAAEELPVSPEAFLLVCPPTGELAAGGAGYQTGLAEAVCQRLNTLFGSGQSVGVAFADVLHRLPPHSQVRYALEMSLYEDAQGTHVALVLRAHPQRLVLATLRHLVAPQACGVDVLAAWAHGQVWQHRLLPEPGGHEPAELPLELRLHEAVRLLGRPSCAGADVDEQLAVLRAAHPEDPAILLLGALNLYTRLLLPQRAESETPAAREQSERDIEHAVFAALPLLAGRPLLALAAARLLCFIDARHADLAEQLAAEAFEQSTAFAAAHSTRGQIMLCKGDTAAALRLFDHAIGMTVRGSEFHVYLLVLKCQVRMCEGRYAQAEAVLDELGEVKPGARRDVGLLLISPTWRKLPPVVQGMAAALTPQVAARVLQYLDRMAARQMKVRENRRNLLRGPVRQLVTRFGMSVVPPRVRDDLADEL